jgi:4-hydroxy 2-oxovalerate aldolase
MHNIKHLDCSLRDGGYYNNWDFKDNFINEYLKVLESINIDFCEIGFRFFKNKGFKGSCAFSTEEFLSTLKIPKTVKIAIMINAGELIEEGELILDRLKNLIPLKANDSKVDMVRVACHSEVTETILPVFDFLHDYGYITACNITQISDKTNERLIELSSLIASSKTDILYFADSLGSASPSSIKSIVNSLRSYWSGQLGIHAHDNRGLALSNTIKAIECGVEWVDSTITGIGRGPGNAKTEELIIEKDKNYIENSLNLVPLTKIINESFLPMKNKYSWGTNIFYYLAGKYSIHPSYIQSMLKDYRYQEEDILASINYLRDQGGKRFDFNDLDETRKFYKGDPKGEWDPSTIFKKRDVLIIGTGLEFKNHEKAVENFIKRFNPLVIAINTKTLSNNNLIDFRIACHPIRLFADVDTHLGLPQPLIIPLSMLPEQFREILKDKDIRDFGIAISNDTFEFHKTHCVTPNALVISYALAVVTSGSVKNIYLAGFDGYEQGDARNEEVNDLLFKYKKSQPQAKVIAITPTKYKNLISKSVYGLY